MTSNDEPKEWASDIGFAAEVKRDLRHRFLHNPPLPPRDELSEQGQYYVDTCDIDLLREQLGRCLSYHNVHQSNDWLDLKLRRSFAFGVLELEKACPTTKIEEYNMTYEVNGEQIHVPFATSPEQLGFLAQKSVTAANTAANDFREMLAVHKATNMVAASAEEEYLDQDVWLAAFVSKTCMWAIICRDMLQNEYFKHQFAGSEDVLIALVRSVLLSNITQALKLQRSTVNHFALLRGDPRTIGVSDSVDELTALMSSTGLGD